MTATTEAKPSGSKRAPAKKKAPAKRKASRRRSIPEAPEITKERGGARPGAGAPPWEPKRKEVETRQGVFRQQTEDEAWEDARALVRHYVAIGYPADVIGKLMVPPISDKTLRKHFSHELENGKLIQDARVAGTGYAMAVSGRDPGMTRFWLRTRMGWTERDADAGQGPIQVESIPGDEGL